MGNNGTTFPIIYASLGLKHGSYYLRYNQYRLRSTLLRVVAGGFLQISVVRKAGVMKFGAELTV